MRPYGDRRKSAFGGRLRPPFVGRGGGPAPVPPLMDFADGVFTRDSVATFHMGLASHEPGELLTRYGVDAPRWRPGGGIYMEAARTNQVLYTYDLTQHAPRATRGAIGPDGVADSALEIESPYSSTFYWRRATVGFSDNDRASFSEMATSSEDGLPASQTWADKAGLLGGTAFIGSGSTNRTWEHVAQNNCDMGTGTGSWYLRWLNANGGTFPKWMGCFGGQAEIGTFATSIIETDGAVGTRAQDLLLMPAASVNPGFFSAPFEIHVRPTASKSETLAMGGVQLMLSPPGSGDYVAITSGLIRVSGSGGTFDTPTIPDWVAGELFRIRVDLSTGTVRVITESHDLTSGATGAQTWTSGDVRIGANSDGSLPFYGAIYPPTAIGAI